MKLTTTLAMAMTMTVMSNLLIVSAQSNQLALSAQSRHLPGTDIIRNINDGVPRNLEKMEKLCRDLVAERNKVPLDQRHVRFFQWFISLYCLDFKWALA